VCYDGKMLSYLHGYHAGNAADVLKHSVLAFCLDYLGEKEKPLLCVDTHSGAGFYDLSGADGRQNTEWEKGIGCLLKAAGEPPAMIASYVNLCGINTLYSGSSVIMARMLRKGDRLVCFELHPRELCTLGASMTEVRGEREDGPLIEVRGEDGAGGLRPLLPPPSRRGLVFVDPPWEDLSEYKSIPRAVTEGLRRFPEGTFIIWYPLLTVPKSAPRSSGEDTSLGDILYGLSGGKRRPRAVCRAELITGTTESSPRGMYGSGLVIFNPPWTLRPALEEALPYLAKVLGGKEGSWELNYGEERAN